MIGMHSTSCELAESVFGAYKYMYCRRRNPGVGQRRASGLAQEMVMKRFSHGPAVRLRKLKKKPPVVGVKKRRQTQSGLGFFHRLPYKEQVALLEMARAEYGAERALNRSDVEELERHHGQTRQSNSELELISLIKRFAHALSFFDRYKERGVKSVGELQQLLEALHLRETAGSSQLQLDWLREQIEMRVVGLGWVEFKTNWSSSKDEVVGTVSDLVGQLKDIMEEEEDREIPEAAVAPILQRKTFRELGTLTMQAKELAD